MPSSRTKGQHYHALQLTQSNQQKCLFGTPSDSLVIGHIIHKLDGDAVARVVNGNLKGQVTMVIFDAPQIGMGAEEDVGRLGIVQPRQLVQGSVSRRGIRGNKLRFLTAGIRTLVMDETFQQQ